MNLTVELNEDIIKNANEILETSYLDVPTVIGILLRRIVKEQSVAFLFPAKDKKPESVKAKTDELPDNILDFIDIIDDDIGQRSEDNDIERRPTYKVQDSKTIDSIYYPLQKSMTKGRAIRLILHEGYHIAPNVTFASKNRGAYNYWANPETSLLKSDWSLILNDWISKKLYLFTIPANSIKLSELTTRTDKQYLIDLQIMYEDETFTDNRSGYSFAKFLTKKFNYKE